MAAPGGKYFIQDQLHLKAPHHESFEQLWATKWKAPCSKGVYPFMFGAIQDFEPIVKKLTEEGHKEPYDWDAYAQTFFSKAEDLVHRASEAEEEGRMEEASELYLRASAVYRIARFPIPRSKNQRQAWIKGKNACIRGLALHSTPMSEIRVPHVNAVPGEGPIIPVYACIPASTTPSPVVVLWTGLDGYRTELCVWAPGFARLGIATIVLEIPGTGDCPGLPSDPSSGDRVLSSLTTWIRSNPALDASRHVVWAFSTGAYHAIRAAHVEPPLATGFVALGGGCHHMFDPEWLGASLSLEYPFDLPHALAVKFGYGDDYESFRNDARRKFSLLEDGTLNKPRCARLLLVNGVEDQIFPIDDYVLALERGAPKEARLVPGRRHMGEPEAFLLILPWIYDRLGVEGNAVEQLATIPFTPKFA